MSSFHHNFICSPEGLNRGDEIGLRTKKLLEESVSRHSDLGELLNQSHRAATRLNSLAAERLGEIRMLERKNEMLMREFTRVRTELSQKETECSELKQKLQQDLQCTFDKDYWSNGLDPFGLGEGSTKEGKTEENPPGETAGQNPPDIAQTVPHIDLPPIDNVSVESWGDNESDLGSDVQNSWRIWYVLFALVFLALSILMLLNPSFPLAKPFRRAVCMPLCEAGDPDFLEQLMNAHRSKSDVKVPDANSSSAETVGGAIIDKTTSSLKFDANQKAHSLKSKSDTIHKGSSLKLEENHLDL